METQILQPKIISSDKEKNSFEEDDTRSFSDVRKEKGLHIAKTSRIREIKKGWKVPSQSGKGHYIVKNRKGETKCNCPDYEERRSKCKHIWAVEFVVTGQIPDIEIKKRKRKTYQQDWPSYNLAQQKEKKHFIEFLADITNNIRQPTYSLGRPTNSLGDTIYSMVLKVYSTFCSRRFAEDLEIAKERGFIEKRIPYNSMLDYFKKKELTTLLAEIVTITSLPLKTVEKDFAIDSTGFGTSNFQRWFSFKHGREICSRRWVKCHFVTGVKTNIIPSVKITSEFDNDCPQLGGLYNKTAEHFDLEEMSADKAYLGIENLELGERNGTRMFIPFKSNSQPSGNGPVWKRLYHYFMFHNEKFLAHYHKRSNVESTVNMIKSKFGDRVRSKTWTAQVNEVLCKIICHNISCVIMEMHCLGVNPCFCPKSQEVARKVDTNP